MTATRPDYDELIQKYATQFNVPLNIARNMMRTESSGNPNATSNKGAMGLMQLMPGTAKQYGVTDPYDPEQNIKAGLNYISDLYGQEGDWRRAAAAYNFGPGNFEKHGMNGIPKETQNYIDRVVPRQGQGSGPYPPGSVGQATSPASFMPGESYGVPQGLPGMLGQNQYSPVLFRGADLSNSGSKSDPLGGRGDGIDLRQPGALQQLAQELGLDATSGMDIKSQNQLAYDNESRAKQQQIDDYMKAVQRSAPPPGYGDMGHAARGLDAGDGEIPGYQDMSQFGHSMLPSLIQMAMRFSGRG